MVDSSADYILSRCMENPYCSKITNKKILCEALNNRLESPQVPDSVKLIHSVCSCLLVPVIINSDDCQEGDIEEPGFEFNHHLGNLEFYFDDKMVTLEASKFEEEKPLYALYPILKLLKDLLPLSSPPVEEEEQEQEEEVLSNLDMSKIEETKSHLDNSHVSISASFLEANKRTSQDALLMYSTTVTTKPLPTFSAFLQITSSSMSKILPCQKSLLHFISPTVESPEKNIFNIPQKTAYFFSSYKESAPGGKHTYKFNYEGTFVQKIIDKQTPVTFVGNKEPPKEVSVRNIVNPGYPKSIMNESWYAIRYLPILVGSGESQKVR